VKQATLSLVHKVAPLPSGTPGPHPGLILLHGRGADEEDLLGLTPFIDPRFLIIAVRAPFQFPYGGYTWYEMLADAAPEPTGFSESYERLVKFIGEVPERYPVDPGRLFLLGFSMGTVMSYGFALTKPRNIRGIVAHSGYIPESSTLSFDLQNLSGTAFFIAHGIHDPVIDVQFARRAKDLLSGTQATVSYKEYPILHSMSEESIGDCAAWLCRHLESGTD